MWRLRVTQSKNDTICLDVGRVINEKKKQPLSTINKCHFRQISSWKILLELKPLRNTPLNGNTYKSRGLCRKFWNISFIFWKPSLFCWLSSNCTSTCINISYSALLNSCQRQWQVKHSNTVQQKPSLLLSGLLLNCGNATHFGLNCHHGSTSKSLFSSDHSFALLYKSSVVSVRGVSRRRLPCFIRN